MSCCIPRDVNKATKKDLQATSLIPFVEGNVLYATAFDDLKTQLGVTGQIKTKGSAQSIPLLTSPASNLYFVANLENGAGTTVTTTPQGAVKVATNLADTVTTGARLIKDATASQIQFRRIIGGNGITITEENDAIQIEQIAGTISNKTVVVNDIADFPTPVSGVIQLAADTDYLITNDLTTDNRFLMADNCVIRAADALVISLTYTGGADMFTGADVSFAVKNISLAAPAASNVFSMNSTLPTSSLVLERMTIDECVKIGTLNGVGIIDVASCFFPQAGSGFTLAGSINFMQIGGSVAVLNTGVFVDLDGATLNGFSMISNGISFIGAGTVLSGLINSGNINVGGLGVVSNNRRTGGTFLNNISNDDARWNFSLNDDVPDTRPDGLLSFTTPTVTTISSSNTPVIINGTWNIERTSQFEGTAAGRLTYLGEKSAVLPMTARVSIEPATGGTVRMGVFIAKNGAVIANSEGFGTGSGGDPTSITVVWQDEVQPNDYYEVWVENDQNSNNLEVLQATFRIN